MARAPGKVLLVLSSAPEQMLQNGKRRPTGNFLSELYEPYRALKSAGYDVVAATPEGGAPTIDPESLDPKYWSEHPSHREVARELVASSAFASPRSRASKSSTSKPS